MLTTEIAEETETLLLSANSVVCVESRSAGSVSSVVRVRITLPGIRYSSARTLDAYKR
jgi:hypothetical protein